MSIIIEALKKAEEKAKIFDRFKNGFKGGFRIKDHPEKSKNRSNRMNLAFIISGGLLFVSILFFVSNRVISHQDMGDEVKPSGEIKNDGFQSKRVRVEEKGPTTSKNKGMMTTSFAKKQSIGSHTKKEMASSPPVEQRGVTSGKKGKPGVLTKEKRPVPPGSNVQQKGFSADHYFKVGNIYYKKGLYDKAIEEYNKGIKISPRHAKLHNNLGNSYLNKGLPDLALKEYQKAVSIDPFYDTSYYNIGCLYSKKADKVKALFHLKKAISLNKENKEWARDETDFDNIRNDKAFKELVY